MQRMQKTKINAKIAKKANTGKIAANSTNAANA